MDPRRRLAQGMREPERSAELQDIEDSMRYMAENEKKSKDEDLLERTLKRDSIVQAYGVGYFRY